MTIVRVRGDPQFVWMEGIPVSFLGLDPKVYCDGQQRELRGIPYGPQTRPPCPGVDPGIEVVNTAVAVMVVKPPRLIRASNGKVEPLNMTQDPSAHWAFPARLPVAQSQCFKLRIPFPSMLILRIGEWNGLLRVSINRPWNLFRTFVDSTNPMWLWLLLLVSSTAG